MKAYYHKQLGMIQDIPQNRKLLINLGYIKTKKDDTPEKEPTKQNSGNSKRAKKRPAAE